MLIRDMFRRQESIRKTLSLKFLQNSTKVNRRRRQLLMMRSLKLPRKMLSQAQMLQLKKRRKIQTPKTDFMKDSKEDPKALCKILSKNP